MAMTPHMKVVHDYVKRTYGLEIGITNCRRISGSQTFSQHSWSNANDIKTSNKRLQDEIAADLKEKFGDHIRNVLTWRFNSAHWNHVHVDMWPKGWLTPPCRGGELKIKYKDGHVTINEPFPSNIEGSDILANITVIQLQEALNRAGQVGANGLILTEDNIFGANTAFAWSNGLRGGEGAKGDQGEPGPAGADGADGAVSELTIRGIKEI